MLSAAADDCDGDGGGGGVGMVMVVCLSYPQRHSSVENLVTKNFPDSFVVVGVGVDIVVVMCTSCSLQYGGLQQPEHSMKTPIAENIPDPFGGGGGGGVW